MILNNNINKEETIMPRFEELCNCERVKVLEEYIKCALSLIVKPNATIIVNDKVCLVCTQYTDVELNSHDGYAEPLGALVFQLELDKKKPNVEHIRPVLHGEFDVDIVWEEHKTPMRLSFDVQKYQFDFEEDKFVFPEDIKFTIVQRR